MRSGFALLISAVVLAGCGGVEYRRGLPILAKPQDGALVAGTAGSADIARGNQARLSGRTDDALRDLEPMAQLGYPDAMLYLAAVYGAQPTIEAQEIAIRWYRRVLPQRPEAVVPLARALTQSGRQKLVAEAEKLLLGALKQDDDLRAAAALLNLYGLFPAFDKTGRAPGLAEKAAVSPVPEVRAAAINWYRDAITDRASAQRLLDLCRKSLDTAPDCHIDLASYYRYSGDHAGLVKQVDQAIAAFDRQSPLAHVDSLDYVPIDTAVIAGRLAVALVDQPGVEDLVEQTEELRTTRDADEIVPLEGAEDNLEGKEKLDTAPQIAATLSAAPPAPQASTAANAEPELANRVLRWMLKRPGTMKIEAAAVAVGFPYLLPDVDLEALLKAGVASGIPRASLMLGELYFFNQRAPREADVAEANFMQALKFRETDIPAHYRLGRLYQQGYLGRPNPAKSLEYFLYAARHRVTAADTHLARLFYDSPGTRVNRVNSYVFAQLSADGGFPVVVRSLRGGTLSAYNLLDRLKTDLTPQELETANAMYQKERPVHLVTRRPIGPQIWAQGVTK